MLRYFIVSSFLFVLLLSVINCEEKAAAEEEEEEELDGEAKISDGRIERIYIFL